MLLITVTKKQYVMLICHVWPIPNPFNKVTFGNDNNLVYEIDAVLHFLKIIYRGYF